MNMGRSAFVFRFLILIKRSLLANQSHTWCNSRKQRKPKATVVSRKTTFCSNFRMELSISRQTVIFCNIVRGNLALSISTRRCQPHKMYASKYKEKSSKKLVQPAGSDVAIRNGLLSM